MKICIGIISYLPDNKKIREKRVEKLKQLILKCDQLFNLPILVITQNWKDINIESNNLIKYNYNQPLGIMQARNILREKFLDSPYDYIILLDDDSEIKGTSAQKYLEQIKSNPDCFIEFQKSRLKLFAISKHCFNKVQFEIQPEKEEGFEDRLFLDRLKEKLPEKRRCFQNTGLEETSLCSNDIYSTWHTTQDYKKMYERYQRLLKK